MPIRVCRFDHTVNLLLLIVIELVLKQLLVSEKFQFSIFHTYSYQPIFLLYNLLQHD